MAWENLGKTISLPAAAAINLFRFHVINSSGQFAQNAVAAGDCAGVSQNNPSASGQACECMVGIGVTKIKLGSGGITAGQPIASDGSGQGIYAATGDRILGYALNTGVSGDIVSMLFQKGAEKTGG